MRMWNRGRGTHRPLSLLFTAAIAGVAMLLFVQSAGATSLVQLQSPGYLRSRGAAVQVNVTVVCNTRRTATVAGASTPARATLTVNLTERSGHGIAVGSGRASMRSGDFRCDGGSHTIVVSVLASPGSKVFVKGSAFGQATLKVCHPSCRSVTDSRSIRLR